MKIIRPLTQRQQALVDLCEEAYIEIGNMRTTAGEDTALYFAWADDMEVYPAEQEVQRFCAVTRSCAGEEEFNYVYPDFADEQTARDEAEGNIGDDIFEELPMMVVDLDTGERVNAHLTVRWRP